MTVSAKITIPLGESHPHGGGSGTSTAGFKDRASNEQTAA